MLIIKKTDNDRYDNLLILFDIPSIENSIDKTFNV